MVSFNNIDLTILVANVVEITASLGTKFSCSSN